jgi:hypothetical protein
MRPLARWLTSQAAAITTAALVATVAAAQTPPDAEPQLAPRAAIQPPPQPAVQTPVAPAAKELPDLPSLEDLSATVERPLFSRNRRPPKAPPPVAAEATPVKVATEDAPADLTGIVSSPEKTYAILTSKQTKETHHLVTGETIDEWSVQEIGPRHVVLRRGPGSLRLDLFAEKEPGEGADGENRRTAQQNMQPRFSPQAARYRQQQQRRQQRRPRRPANDD